MEMHRLIRSVIVAWEAHRRQKRFKRMLLTSKAFAAAHEAVVRDRGAHRPTRAALKQMRQALHDELKQETWGNRC